MSLESRTCGKYLAIGLVVPVVILGLVTVSSMNLGVWRSIYPPVSKVRTESNKVVQLILSDDLGRKGLRLNVPKAYLVNARNWRGGEQEVINIETQLPDLLPASALPPRAGAPGTKEYEASQAQFRNGIAITLLGSRAVIPEGMPGHRGRITEANRSVTDSTKFELISSNYYGLQGYRDLSCSRSQFPASVRNGQEYCVDSLRQHYLPAITDAATVHIICTSVNHPRFKARMGCQAYSEFAGHQLTYVFRASELPRWREFYDGVQQLLGRFQAQAN